MMAKKPAEDPQLKAAVKAAVKEAEQKATLKEQPSAEYKGHSHPA